MQSVHRHRKELGDCWLAILKLPLPGQMYRRVLLHLPKRVMAYMTQPLRLADFFTDSYDVGGGISLLALHGLFLLMHRHGLDYPRFYPKLYALLQPSVFHAQHRSRFFELLNLFLTSSYLPIYLVAAFAKRMSRLALGAPPAGALFAIPLVYELLARHPQCRVMIHRPIKSKKSTAATDATGTGAAAAAGDETEVTIPTFAAVKRGEDPFVQNEGDMAKCRAMESSLWELNSLTSHYHPDVAELAGVFSQKFLDAHTPVCISRSVSTSLVCVCLRVGGHACFCVWCVYSVVVVPVPNFSIMRLNS